MYNTNKLKHSSINHFDTKEVIKGDDVAKLIDKHNKITKYKVYNKEINGLKLNKTIIDRNIWKDTVIEKGILTDLEFYRTVLELIVFNKCILKTIRINRLNTTQSVCYIDSELDDVDVVSGFNMFTSCTLKNMDFCDRSLLFNPDAVDHIAVVECTFIRCYFRDSDFRGVDLSHCKFFKCDFTGAKYDEMTKFPTKFCRYGMIWSPQDKKAEYNTI